MIEPARPQNPVLRLRTRLAMSRAELARATGVPYRSLTNAEGGYSARLPRQVLSLLVAAGVNARTAEREYQAWLSSLRRPLQAGQDDPA